MLTNPAFTEVVDHHFHVFKHTGPIGPEVGSMGFLVARLEHRHGRFVSVQHGAAENLVLQRIDQRLQINPAHAHPLSQC